MAKSAAQTSKEAEPAPNAFIGKPEAPNERELSAALGRAHTLWRDLLNALASVGADECEWHCYSRKAGWSLRVKRGDRTIVYLSPCVGTFRAAFALGDRAIQQALASKLAPPVLENIRTSRKYAEGTAVRLNVDNRADVTAVKRLAAIKIDN